jgi:hypothetical protein
MRRFQKGGGVTQPSQIRSIKYFEKVLNGYVSLNQMIDPAIVVLDSSKMYGIPKLSSNYFRPYFEVYSVRDSHMVYTSNDPDKKTSLKKFPVTETKKDGPSIHVPFINAPPMIGDILIKVYHSATLNSKLAFRFAFNTAFLTVDSENNASVRFTIEELDPDTTKKDPKFPGSFVVELCMKVICRIPSVEDPNFQKYIKYYELERPGWDIIYSILKDYRTPSKKESTILLFKDPDRDNVEDFISGDKKPEGSGDNSFENLSGDSDSGNELNSSYSKEDSPNSEGQNSGGSNKVSDDEN